MSLFRRRFIRFNWLRLALLTAFCFVSAFAGSFQMPVQAATYDWLQFFGDARHNGNNTAETSISAANVSGLTRKWQVSMSATADGSPVVLNGVQTSAGLKNLIFVTTTDGRIRAMDIADGSLVWEHQPATGPRYTTSSPAIDPNRQFVYSYGLEGKVHKYQVGDGTEITTGGWPQLTTLKPDVEKGSSALTIATDASSTTYLYVTNGGYPGDQGDYQGHVTTINLVTGTQNILTWRAAIRPFTSRRLHPIARMFKMQSGRVSVSFIVPRQTAFMARRVMATSTGTRAAKIGATPFSRSIRTVLARMAFLWIPIHRLNSSTSKTLMPIWAVLPRPFYRQ